jgi:hypothetical protein
MLCHNSYDLVTIALAYAPAGTGALALGDCYRADWGGSAGGLANYRAAPTSSVRPYLLSQFSTIQQYRTQDVPRLIARVTVVGLCRLHQRIELID